MQLGIMMNVVTVMLNICKYLCCIADIWLTLCLLAQISKATTLQKTAEYINKMQQERAQLHDEAQRLREEIQLLNSAIK